MFAAPQQSFYVLLRKTEEGEYVHVFCDAEDSTDAERKAVRAAPNHDLEIVRTERFSEFAAQPL